MIDAKKPKQPKSKNSNKLANSPYDALLTPDGRYYLAGCLVNPVWHCWIYGIYEQGVKPILNDYGQHEAQLPVYKMPHLEGWAVAGDLMFVPAMAHHEVLVIDKRNWAIGKTNSRCRTTRFCNGATGWQTNLG